MATSAKRQVSIFVNGKEVEASAKAISAAYREVSNQLGKMVIGSDEYLAKLEEVKMLDKYLTAHRESIKGVESAWDAAEGSAKRITAEYNKAAEELGKLAIGSEQYVEKLKEVRQLDAALNQHRNDLKGLDVVVKGSAKSIEIAYRKAVDELEKMVVGSKEYIDTLENVHKLDAELKKHRDAVKGVEQGWDMAKGGMGAFIGVAAGAFTVDAIIDYGKQLLGTATNLDLLEKKARVVFGDVLPQVTAAAEANAATMGLTNSQYVAAAANIQDLLVPMGFQRQQAADLSMGLVDLSGALSEWSGGTRSASEVSDILAKALLGERDALNSLGIDIKQAEVDAELFARGLDKLSGNALKQAEAMVTLDLIYRKSTDAQAAFADGSDSMARKQAENTARLTAAWEKLAVSLIPLFEDFARIATDAANAVGWISGSLEALSNPSKVAAREFESQAEKVKGLTNNIAPLLDRYDTLKSKSALSSEEQAEMTNILKQVSGQVPLVSVEFDRYGQAIGLSTAEIRQYIEAEKEALKVRNATAIDEYKTKIQSLNFELKVNQERVSRFRNKETFLGIELETAASADAAVKKINALNREIAETQKALDRLSGKSVAPTAAEGAPAATSTPTGPTEEEKKAAEAQAKERQKKREQAAKDLEAHLARIQDIVKKNQEAAYLDSLSADERELERVRLRYDKEIEQVKSKFANNKAVQEAAAALELQKEEELEKLRQEQRDRRTEAEVTAEKDRLEKLEKVRLDEEEKRKKAEEDIATFIKEGEEQSPYEIELAALEAHYEQLLELASKYGINVNQITDAYLKQKAEIEKKYRTGIEKDEEKSAKTRLEALAKLYSQIGDLISVSFDFIAGESEEFAEFQKIATLAKIAFDTASAISSLAAYAEANPGNVLTGGLAGIGIYIAGLTRIIANFAAAKKALSAAPAVKQKAEGGFLSVTGESDGRQYSARVLAPPQTGLLPGFPVVFQSSATGAPVLASERGAEYFVAASDLRNPYVANLVRMVDNITHSRGGIPQFAEGGATTTLPQSASASPPVGAAPAFDAGALRELAAAVSTLNALLSRGIVAVVPDRTITDINDRFKEINTGSGGFFT